MLDDEGRYQGVVTARAVADTVADGTHDTASVRLLVERPDVVTTQTPLEEALDALESTAGAVPVLDPGAPPWSGG